MIRRPPRSTLFPTRRSSDLSLVTLMGLGISGFPFVGSDIGGVGPDTGVVQDRKSTRLNSSHVSISYAVFCLKKKKKKKTTIHIDNHPYIAVVEVNLSI